MVPMNCSAVLQETVSEDLDPFFIGLEYFHKVFYYMSYSTYFGASAKMEPFLQ